MELSETEIKECIGDGRIRAITLDTCIFEGNGNRFERGLLAKLSQFNDTAVRFVLSDVVAGEVMSHVTKEAQDSMSAVRTALKEVGRCWQTTIEQRDTALHALFNNEAPRTLAKRRFDAFTEVMLPLLCGVLSSLLTRPFCAVPRTSVSRIAWG